MASRTGSQNNFLMILLALLAYLPFRTIAKITLQISLLLFIADPIPPYSRIISLMAVGVVFILSKLERQHSTYIQNLDSISESNTNSNGRMSNDDFKSH